MGYDNYSIIDYVKNQLNIKKIRVAYQKEKSEFKHNYISEIILAQDESNDFDVNLFAFVAYHHGGDPSSFEVIVEVAKLLGELNIKY